MKWLRRLVFLAPAVGSLVLAWQQRDSGFVALSLIGAALWAYDGVKRIKEVDSE